MVVYQLNLAMCAITCQIHRQCIIYCTAVPRCQKTGPIQANTVPMIQRVSDKFHFLTIYMCFDVQTSIQGFVGATLASSILIYKGSRECVWIAGFSMTFACIQLLEAAVWNNIERVAVRKKWSSWIPFALAMQPIVQTLGSYWATGFCAWLLPVIILGMCASLFGINRSDLASVCSADSKVGPNHHLVWEFYPAPDRLTWHLYLIGLFLPLLSIRSVWAKVILILYGVVSAISSVTSSSQEYSSLWCHRALLFPALACCCL